MDDRWWNGWCMAMATIHDDSCLLLKNGCWVCHRRGYVILRPGDTASRLGCRPRWLTRQPTTNVATEPAHLFLQLHFSLLPSFDHHGAWISARMNGKGCFHMLIPVTGVQWSQGQGDPSEHRDGEAQHRRCPSRHPSIRSLIKKRNCNTTGSEWNTHSDDVHQIPWRWVSKAAGGRIRCIFWDSREGWAIWQGGGRSSRKARATGNSHD